MDKFKRNQLYDRITYLLFSVLVCLTMIFPMFSVKHVVGENSDVVCSSVSAIQIMRVGLSSEEKRAERMESLYLEIDEYYEKRQADGVKDADINNELKTLASYNEYCLLELMEDDSEGVIKPMAICLLISYALIALLAVLYFVSILVRKTALDTANLFVNIAAAVATIVALALSFTLKIAINASSSYLICSELVMYVFAVAPVALALIQAIRLFVTKKKQKVKEGEVIESFTDANKGE